jgi:hypothetical protein
MRLRSIAIGGGVVLLGFVALSILMSLAGFVFRGAGGDDDEQAGSPATSSTSPTPSVVTSGPARPDATAADPRLGPPVVVDLGDPEAFAPPPSLVSGLTDGTVVPVTASGFPADSDGQASQCAGPGRCGPSIPVRFDGSGRAQFLFLLADGVPGGPACRGSVRCTLVVSGEGGRRAAAVTGFGPRRLPEPAVTVRPRVDLADGSVVRVRLSGFPPGATATVLQCVAPASAGPRRCGEPGPVVHTTVGRDGAASVDFTVRTGRVGSEDGVRCERRRICGLSVVVDGAALDAVVPITFSAGPTADYDAGRLALGLGLAAAFGLVAVALGVRTRWRLHPDPFA